MLTKRLQKIVLATGWAFIIALPLIIHFSNNRDNGLGDIDEGAWVFKTYYYHLAFQRFDFTHPDWQDKEMFDGPPIGRWIFGVALATQGLVETSPHNQRWWQQNAFDLYRYPEFIRELVSRTSPEAILTLRAVAFFFALLTLLMVYLLGAQISSKVGVIAAMFLALNPLFQKYAALGMTDTQIMFWICAATNLQIWLARRLASGEAVSGRFTGWLALLALVMALAFLTKITATMVWTCWALLCGAQFLCVADRVVRLRLAAACAGTLILSFLFVIMLHPTLWPQPIENFVRLFTFRWELLHYQREIFLAHEFGDWGRRFVHTVREIFFEHSLFFRWVRLPLEFIFCLLAFFLLARETNQSEKTRVALPATALLAIAFLAIVGQTFYLYALDWPHYLLTALPLVSVLAAFGLWRSIEPFFRENTTALKTFHTQLVRPWSLVALIVIIAALVTVGPLRMPINSLTLEERFLHQHETTLKYFHPHDKVVKATLAVLNQQAGNPQRAEMLWKEVFTIDAKEEVFPIVNHRSRFFQEAAQRYPDWKPLQDWLMLAHRRSRFSCGNENLYINGVPTFLFGFVLESRNFPTPSAFDEIRQNTLNTISINIAKDNPTTEDTIAETTLTSLKTLCTEADRRDIMVGISLSRDGLGDQRAHMLVLETLIETLRPHPNIYFNLAIGRNERDAQFVPIAELRELRDRVKTIDPYRLVTSTHTGHLTLNELRDYLEVARLDFLTLSQNRINQIDEIKQWMRDINRVVPICLRSPSKPNLMLDLQAASNTAGWSFIPRMKMSDANFLSWLDQDSREFLETIRTMRVDTTHDGI